MAGLSNLWLSVDGRDHALGPAVQVGFTAEFDERIVPEFSIAARWNVTWTNTEFWSHERSLHDIGLEPKLWGHLRGSRWEYYAGPFAGISLSENEPRELRAFVERTETVWSYHAGLALGAVFPRRLQPLGSAGLQLELGYLLHFTRLRVHLAPRAAGAEEIVEDWRYTDGLFYLSAGLALGFGSL
ncbi:MAG TPA: hypothetical protein VGK73_24830 [Polyangiaceae bacterium]